MTKKYENIKSSLDGDNLKEFETILDHIKNLDRLNRQLKDKVMFEKENCLVDYSKLKVEDGRVSGEDWIKQWLKTYGEEP